MTQRPPIRAKQINVLLQRGISKDDPHLQARLDGRLQGLVKVGRPYVPPALRGTAVRHFGRQEPVVVGRKGALVDVVDAAELLVKPRRHTRPLLGLPGAAGAVLLVQQQQKVGTAAA